MSFQTVVNYDTAGHFSFDTTKVEVSGSLIRLKDLGGSTYATDSPTVETQHRIQATALTSFAHSASQPAGSSVKYQLLIGAGVYYHNGSTWVASDGTVSQSNTQAEITAALGTLFSALGLPETIFLRVRVFLTSNGTAQPSVTSNTWVYSMSYLSPASISECLVSCYITDLLGADYVLDSSKPATLHVKSYRAFMHGSKLVRPFTKSANFDADGLAQLSVIETQSIEQPLEFLVTYFEGEYKKQVRFIPAVVPNSPAANLNSVSTVSSLDMG